MRAISTKIDEKTAVAKLILPNDRVDVIVTDKAGNTVSDLTQADFEIVEEKKAP